jgi:hypothetical protein
MNIHKAPAVRPASSGDVGSPTVLRLGLALGLVVAAQFVLQLDSSIVNIALPTTRRELHFAPAEGATAAGASAGVVLGGVFTEFIGWWAVFLVNPPIIVVLVIAIRRVLPARTGRTGARLDIVGATLATASIALLIFGLGQGQQYGFANASALAALCMTVVLFGAVVVGYVYFSSLYNQDVLHFSPLQAGLAFIPAASDRASEGGYKAASLGSIGISVVAALIAATQMRTRSAPKGTPPKGTA